MKKFGDIKLYRLGEVVDILAQDFNYHTTNSILCKKLATLNAYIQYENVRYIPENIICDLMENIRKKEKKSQIRTIIQNKIEIINNEISKYSQNNKTYTQKTNNIKIQNIETKENHSAFIQLKEEIKNLTETIQKEIKKKDNEIAKLKEEINNLTEKKQTKLIIESKSHSKILNKKNI
ncbi:hypothetical protein [Borrelia hispanica]|uniref:hypothetical protein n=1 Tax=Borrelia hispanica TaxID=40835 RepID=UPI000466F3B2|nr:hypothetical protein [Borrelia hispanica]